MAQPLPDNLKTTVHPNGKVTVAANGTVVTYHRPLFGVMIIELTGNENAALTNLFFSLLQKELAYEQRRWPRSANGPEIQLFVDAERVTRHGLMFEAWIRFLIQHRQRLSGIHILAVNRVSQLSVKIIRHLSGSERLIQLYDNPQEFREALQSSAVPSAPRPGYLAGAIGRIRRYIDGMRWQRFPGEWQD